jgi:hypothetical protein
MGIKKGERPNIPLQHPPHIPTATTPLDLRTNHMSKALFLHFPTTLLVAPTRMIRTHVDKGVLLVPAGEVGVDV